LFNGELDNGHYDNLFSLEEKRTGIFDNSFTNSFHQKHFNNNTVYKYTLSVIIDKVTMKIFKLKRVGVRAG
jgi:hypothetical protein